MGLKNEIDIDSVKSQWEGWVQDLLPILEPFFKQLGKVDLSNANPSYDISSSLVSILQCKILLEDDGCGNLCGDDILAKQIIVEKDGLMKLWGIIYWLQPPAHYEINKSGLDPFYAEFRLRNKKLTVEKMKCGDYEKTNLNRVWWFDFELDWIYDFEALNEHTTISKKH